MTLNEYIKNNTMRVSLGYRGGGIEISLDELLDVSGYCMTAYQNYLGGGMLGRVCNSYNFDINTLTDQQKDLVHEMTEALNRYVHAATNHVGDEWEETSYEQSQTRPASAY